MIGSAGLILRGVSAGYGETVVIESIALDLPPGETLAVLGRNGVGKTTLLATIMGHTRLRSGSIRFTDLELACLSAGAPRHWLCAAGARDLPVADR
jgi:branched-chain amino acid transport system ATP-binding protein